MPEPLLLVVALIAAGALVARPLLQRDVEPPAVDDELEAAALRHRVALEALRDVEADRRAGSLDDAAYEAQLAEAEARAVETRAALDAATERRGRPPDADASHRSGRAALLAAGAIGAALVAGSLVPGTGLANSTVVNRQLAEAQEAEAERQDGITALLERVAEDPRDAEALSALADAYLEGGSADDLVRAAVALRLLIDVEPQRADAYERIITAYIRAGDFVNARAALDAYVAIPTASQIEVAFFEGLVALRGEDDPEAAVDAFDRFLELAPDDGRAAMVRELRDEAASAPEP